jgi:SpoVK/Ycf46/Vps4 family AAA+-type ATPase
MNKQSDGRLSGFKTSYQKKTVLCKSLIDALDENDKKINVDNDLDNDLENTLIKDKIKDKDVSKEEIDKLINRINERADNNSYYSPSFTGWTDYEALKSKKEINDPNLFQDAIYLNLNLNINRGIKNPINFVAEKKIDKPLINIDVEIENLGSIIKLINDFPSDEKVEYNINMAALYKIKEPLIELNNMIGMKEMKENIVDQILYYIQDLHKVKSGVVTGDFMHTVIYGPPGTGKTEVAKIIGKIFSKLGILKKGTFRKVTRSDLVAGYLGQTAIKTRDVINECLGGCLFIDEAYALGNNEKRDSFSKECIDTLCEALSNHKDELMVIIAGYERELNECFFAYNQGLDSRFTWRFKTEDYKAEDLYKIFLKKVKDINWTVDETDDKIGVKWFEKNVDYFKFFGRDIETLLSKIKIAHSRRVFCKGLAEKTKITFKDLEKGLQIYLKNDEVKNRKETAFREGYLQRTMYV